MTTVQTNACEHCGLTFETNHYKQRFCTEACQKKKYRIDHGDSPQMAANSIRSSLRKKGLTEEDYAFALQNQNYVCAICNQPETRIFNGKLTRLSVDHSHKYRTYRGLLCMSCNTGLGKFKDDIGLLKQAIQYLEKHDLEKYMRTQ